MENFLNMMFKADGPVPPDPCISSLNHKFEGALNVEWAERENGYEAVFHKDLSEYIALFSHEGVLLEYKQYLPPAYLPEPIKSYLESKGEIMNIVLRNKGNMIEFEAIIRDLNLVRYLVILSENGRVMEERKL